MKLYNLGILPGYDSMTIFHGMAYEGHEGFVIVSPRDPIVSLGYFQDFESSVNVKYCRENNLRLLRREVGGGTTLLDVNQIFYQIIFHPDDERFPKDTLSLYKMLSEPVIETYRDLGVEVKYKEVNDLITASGNKKISGEGGANIGKMKVFVGSVILDFDMEQMSRLFPVPMEEHREQLLKSLKNGMSTIKLELGHVPSREKVIERLRFNYEKILGTLENGTLPPSVLQRARELEMLYTSDEFLGRRGRKRESFKIAAEVNVHHGMHKAVGGRIFSVFEMREGKIRELRLFGDFTFLPKEKLLELEKEIAGLEPDFGALTSRISEFIIRENVDCPGVTPEDLAMSVTNAFLK